MQQLKISSKLEPFVRATGTVKIDFPAMTAITRNRVIKMVEDLYCPWDYTSVTGEIRKLIHPHHLRIDSALVSPMQWGEFPIKERETFNTLLLLHGWRLEGDPNIAPSTEPSYATIRHFFSSYDITIVPNAKTKHSYADMRKYFHKQFGERIRQWRMIRLTRDERDFRQVLLDQARDNYPFKFITPFRGY